MFLQFHTFITTLRQKFYNSFAHQHVRDQLTKIVVTIGVFSLLLIPGTYAALNDRELSSDTKWGTGSLDVDIQHSENFFGQSDLQDTDPDLDPPQPLTIANIGSQPFFYELTGNAENCQQADIILWHNGSTTPAYSGELAGLHLTNPESMILLFFNSARWWYQLDISQEAHCQPELLVIARQHEADDQTGFSDQASLSLSPFTNISDVNVFSSLSLPEIFDTELATDDETTIRQFGSFLLAEIIPSSAVDRISYTIRYSHDSGQVERHGEITPNVLGEFSLPEQYLGDCNSTETVCNPHSGVSNLEISFDWIHGEEVIQHRNFPLEWYDQVL